MAESQFGEQKEVHQDEPVEERRGAARAGGHACGEGSAAEGPSPRGGEPGQEEVHSAVPGGTQGEENGGLLPQGER